MLDMRQRLLLALICQSTMRLQHAVVTVCFGNRFKALCNVPIGSSFEFFLFLLNMKLKIDIDIDKMHRNQKSIGETDWNYSSWHGQWIGEIVVRCRRSGGRCGGGCESRLCTYGSRCDSTARRRWRVAHVLELSDDVVGLAQRYRYRIRTVSLDGR